MRNLNARALRRLLHTCQQGLAAENGSLCEAHSAGTRAAGGMSDGKWTLIRSQPKARDQHTEGEENPHQDHLGQHANCRGRPVRRHIRSVRRGKEEQCDRRRHCDHHNRSQDAAHRHAPEYAILPARWPSQIAPGHVTKVSQYVVTRPTPLSCAPAHDLCPSHEFMFRRGVGVPALPRGRYPLSGPGPRIEGPANIQQF